MTRSGLNWLAGKGRPLRGEITVPGDKSVSHRAIMLGGLADGTTRVTGFLEGEDTLATARIFSQLGVRIDAPSAAERIVHGVGLDGLQPSPTPLDCGNAGTAMRLLAGLLAGQAFGSTLVGDESLSRRPMRRVIEPLTRMGARIDSREGGFPPLIIHSKNDLQGIDFESPVASAQVKSAVLLAGLFAQGETTVREPQPTRDYTESMLASFGYPVRYAPGSAHISGGHRLRATQIEVPADFSSAAFFLVAATVVPGSDVLLRGVGINPRRTGLLTALRQMGADIVEDALTVRSGERVADLRVRSAKLRGIELDQALVGDMIDEFPAFFVAAALASGQTRICGASELRVKESDRIASMAAGLRAMGANILETPDGAVIEGGLLQGARASSHGDHRIAMALAVAAQCAQGEVVIEDCGNVATSFPGFADLARSIGFMLQITETNNV